MRIRKMIPYTKEQLQNWREKAIRKPVRKYRVLRCHFKKGILQGSDKHW